MILKIVHVLLFPKNSKYSLKGIERVVVSFTSLVLHGPKISSDDYLIRKDHPTNGTLHDGTKAKVSEEGNPLFHWKSVVPIRGTHTGEGPSPSSGTQKPAVLVMTGFVSLDSEALLGLVQSVL